MKVVRSPSNMVSIEMNTVYIIQNHQSSIKNYVSQAMDNLKNSSRRRMKTFWIVDLTKYFLWNKQYVCCQTEFTLNSFLLMPCSLYVHKPILQSTFGRKCFWFISFPLWFWCFTYGWNCNGLIGPKKVFIKLNPYFHLAISTDLLQKLNIWTSIYKRTQKKPKIWNIMADIFLKIQRFSSTTLIWWDKYLSRTLITSLIGWVRISPDLFKLAIMLMFCGPSKCQWPVEVTKIFYN